jgi:hypothetical protein
VGRSCGEVLGDGTGGIHGEGWMSTVDGAGATIEPTSGNCSVAVLPLNVVASWYEGWSEMGENILAPGKDENDAVR